MVKADPSRNYYADLKVSANASENEIRKAFRTLALQCHPDRNPGREAEFVTKFQDIQAAHEVLSDATQRAKYDTERKKYRHLNIPVNTPNTPRTRPPPPSRNVYTTTTPSGSYYRAPPANPSPQQQQQQRPPAPQHHNTFNTGADKFTSKNFRPPPTAQRHDARAKDTEDRANVFTAWQKMKPRHEEARQHATNAHSSSQTGAKSHPNGIPFGRSFSTRVPSSKQGYNPAAPGADEGQARSAYRNHTRPDPTPPQSTTPPHSHPILEKDRHARGVPFSETNRPRAPYYPNVAGERISMFDGPGRSASIRNSPLRSHRQSPTQGSGSHSDSGHKHQQRNSYGGNPSGQFSYMYPDSSDGESDLEDLRRGHKHKDSITPPPPPPPPPPGWDHTGPGAAQHGRNNLHPLVCDQAKPETFQPRRNSESIAGEVPNSFKSWREEGSKMEYSPSKWQGVFDGNTDYFAPMTERNSTSKGQSSPTRGRTPLKNKSSNPIPPPPPPLPQAQAQAQSFPIPPPPAGPPPNNNRQAPIDAGFGAAKFSPTAWAETFSSPNWVHTEWKEALPRRASEVIKRPKVVRKPSAPATGDSKPPSQSNASRPKHQAFAEEVSGDGDAMDIDTSTPVREGAQRASLDMLKPGPANAAKEPSQPRGNSAATASCQAGCSGLDDILGLGKVEPFVLTSNDGLELNGLKEHLPFPSQSEDSSATKSDSAQKLKHPEVPVAPIPHQKLDALSADQYFCRMEAYVKAYRAYSKAMTAHFVARDAELEALDDNFVHQWNDTSKKAGFAGYCARMREDEKVMQTWKVAQELHIQALQRCEETRNKVKRLFLMRQK